MEKILVLNPGSTSTKVAVFHNEELFWQKNLHHSNEELAKFKEIKDQYLFRKEAIESELEKEGIALSELTLIMSRGGLLKPIPSGVYQVNKQMVEDLKTSPKQHASNLAAIIAYSLSNELNIKAYIADPVVVDELSDVARFSGHPEFPRKSIFHALNQKAIARQYADQIGKSYEELNLVVIHMGGGISVAAHQHGKAIDVNQALDGEGPFSPERSGTLPVGDIIRAAYSGKYTEKELHSMVVGKGGMVAYCGKNDALAVENDIAKGNELAKQVYEAMGYQISKEVGAMATVLKGKVDAIIFTGGLAYSKFLVNIIKEYISYLAPIVVFPGEDEMKALALNGIRLSNKEVESTVYQ
ncbi:butyrate kinase [Sediminitomix flava]|uniref:Probable butyrate kinase n=1 Tax=Sediminitomix flava TaxID=379075 RepID=A0A315Z698_SEDFL|nr:butyrate kinase [Sediminitomix flava]PWJ39242.1 butyrate kinase [Sediminitomix flava]